MPLTSPLVLDPVLVPKPWGGTRLHTFGRHTDPQARIGESWDVADLPAEATVVPDPVSRIIGGEWDGCSLAEVLAADRAGLLGTAEPAGGRFPLLVKVLDAAETLSVQVHPPRSLDPQRYKTESWVVLDAEPGSELLLGVDDGVTLAQVRAAIGTAGLIELLRRVPVTAGDVVHVPAGTIHAIGAGVLVAEVQTPSDVTHRLWDWPEQRDGGRELHTAEGLTSIEAGWEHNLTIEVASGAAGRVVTTDAYHLTEEQLTAGETLAASTSESVRVVLVLQGSVAWEVDGQQHERGRTESVVLPAACHLPLRATAPDTTVLVATPT